MLSWAGSLCGVKKIPTMFLFLIYWFDGKIVETEKRTGHVAWRHPRSNGEVELVEMKGDLKLENVNFGYFDDHMVLHDIDVFANPGEKIAFVGATGAGKTTITNLINRFYDIQSGTITYDGIDIKLIDVYKRQVWGCLYGNGPSYITI